MWGTFPPQSENWATWPIELIPAVMSSDHIQVRPKSLSHEPRFGRAVLIRAIILKAPSRLLVCRSGDDFNPNSNPAIQFGRSVPASALWHSYDGILFASSTVCLFTA